ncbi:MAG: HAD-IA family hydrolase [Gammaproteobacteria bacterium]|nr:HAD-IA family hydrolase [Gammaproteobacteria bacterium]
MTHAINAVLFDLDGTLLDTALDLLQALNRLRQKFALSPLPMSALRPLVSLGSKAMIKYAFEIEEHEQQFDPLRKEFLTYYEENIVATTVFFPQIEKVLLQLDEQNIPWGIVTNKPIKYTKKILQQLQFEKRPACTICGDTLATYKPDPAPILYACQLLKISPENCLYVGDAATDVIASKAAGTKSLVALYGYINSHAEALTWEADGYINEPLELIDWLLKFPMNEPT